MKLNIPSFVHRKSLGLEYITNGSHGLEIQTTSIFAEPHWMLRSFLPVTTTCNHVKLYNNNTTCLPAPNTKQLINTIVTIARVEIMYLDIIRLSLRCMFSIRPHDNHVIKLYQPQHNAVN